MNRRYFRRFETTKLISIENYYYYRPMTRAYTLVVTLTYNSR